MELDKPKKIIIGVLIFLVIASIFSIISKIKDLTKPRFTAPKIDAIRKPFPYSHKVSAKRYKAYEEIFEDNGVVLVYGYTPGALDNKQGIPFHEELTSLIESENINIKVIPFKNWKTRKTQLENKYLNNTSTCMMTSVVEDLDEYLRFINKCMSGTCLIETGARKYTFIRRDIPYIIKILKERIK